MVLIVSHPDDLHTGAVVEELERLGAEPFVLDLSRYPVAGSLAVAFDGVGVPKAAWRDKSELARDLGRVRSAWWRRPQPITLCPSVREPEARRFAMGEADELAAGLWRCLDAFWVNDPVHDEAAHRKPWQLRLAREVGLETSRTLMTNDPDAARAFVSEVGAGRTIYKSFAATERSWRETRLLRDNDLALFGLVRHAPVIFQEYIPGADVRVTVIGDRIFAGAVDAGSGDYPVDFRVSAGARAFEAIDLPDKVGARLITLMRRLQLVYGAADFRRTEDGRFVFLELNPAGQWLFVEKDTGLPITAALAGLLAEAPGRVRASSTDATA